MAGYRTGSAKRELITTTASITLSSGDTGKTVCNVGASGSVTVTLPAPTSCIPGSDILILSCENQDLVATCSTADSLIIMNDTAADSTSLATANEKSGGAFLCTCVTTKWHIAPMLTEAQTQTTAT